MTDVAMVAPKRICVDFDGTLCDHEFPNIGKLKPGAREALELFRSLGYIIIIHSCRTSQWDCDIFGGNPNEHSFTRTTVQDMISYLHANNLPYDAIDDGTKGKPVADFYIDDKAVRFEDNWEAIKLFIGIQHYTD